MVISNRLFVTIKIMCAVFAVSCNNVKNKAISTNDTIDKITSYYNYRIHYSDSVANPEILLELTVKNDNAFGVMIKRPFMLIVNRDKLDTTTFDEIFNLADIRKIPSELAYEDSVTGQSSNPLFFDLEHYILDSVNPVNMERVKLKNSDLYGYSFIHPLKTSVFLLNLTMFLDRHPGRYKVFPYYDTITYDYNVPVVPLEFKGYRKVSDNIKFDTFYLESNHKLGNLDTVRAMRGFR